MLLMVVVGRRIDNIRDTYKELKQQKITDSDGALNDIRDTYKELKLGILFVMLIDFILY